MVRLFECITVFVTTYALILPAISLSQDTARQQDGIVLEESVDTEQTETVSGNNVLVSPEQTEYVADGSEQLSGDFMEEGREDTAFLTGTIYPKTLDLRFEKKMDADVMEDPIPRGTVVTVLEDQEDGWLLISTPDGRSGYVKAAEILFPGEKVEETRPKMTFELIADKDSPDAEIVEDYIDGTFPDPVTVRVEAPSGAFPAGTTMKVNPIAEEQVREAVESVMPNTEFVSRVSAVDITFIDIWGDEIEPDSEIKVSLTGESVPADEEPHVVHVDDEGQAEMVEAKKEEENVVFESDKFSVFAVVETIEKYVLASDGYNYKISVTCGTETGVPWGSDLVVDEITEGLSVYGKSYADYVSYTENALGMDKGSAGYIRLFDIKIVDGNGEKIQPAEGSKVDVKIELADTRSSDLRIVHFADDSADGDVITNADILPAEDENGIVVSFETSGFSAYAIVTGPTEGINNGILSTLSDVADAVTENESLYLSVNRSGNYEEYFTSTVKTGTNKVLLVSSNIDQAGQWIFEPTGGENAYRIRTAAGQYIKHSPNSGNNNNIELTDALDSASVFILEPPDADGRFTIKLSTGNKWLQYSDGGGGIRLYQEKSNVKNSHIQIRLVNSPEIDSDPYDLDNRTYGLMSWGDGASGKAMTASGSVEHTLDVDPLTVMSNSGGDMIYVSKSIEDITMWTFEWLEDDKYSLKTAVDGEEKYLNITPQGLSMSDDPVPIQVVPGTGVRAGQICLKKDGTTLTYNSAAGEGSASSFGVGGIAGSEWLYLLEPSTLTNDYSLTHTAEKVSVSDTSKVTNGSRVIVYTRVWNDSTARYEYYAIDHDGSLVPVYEFGDSIRWVGPQVNSMLWNFVEYYTEGTDDPNYFYELYNQYSESYIAPQIGGTTVLSDDPVGINLPGRKIGQYYSKIVTWDDNNYSYAGLGVDEIGFSNISTKLNDADDFYFAIVQDIPIDDTLNTVSTIDNELYGITMKMVNYNNTPTAKAGSTTTSKAQQDVLNDSRGFVQSAAYSTNPGLLSSDLKEDGYPKASGGSLINLFGSGASEVNHLFIESTYNETGYFEFDSSQNYAYLNGTDFRVYREIGTADSPGNKPTLKHGQFYPYNDIEAGTFASVNGKNLYNVTSTPISQSDPRYNENLYLVRNPDFYFGMELEASFTQTENGLDDWGHPIIFEFTGDDDFWLYVNGELVLDLGGMHSAVGGSVNFATGAVNVNGSPTNLREIFETNYRKRNPNATDNDVDAYLAEYFEPDENHFKNFSTNTMRIFFMERGGGASNLHMRFNLASVRPNTVELTKNISGFDGDASAVGEYVYQIKYKEKDSSVEKLLQYDDDPLAAQVKYKGTDTPVKGRDSLTIGGTTYQDVFLLKPGETAVIELPDAESYTIVECGLKDGVYEKVSVNGNEVAGTATSAGGYSDYDCGYSTLKERNSVIYDNKVHPDAFRELSIEKKLFREDGTTPIHFADDSTLFNFRLYLGTEYDTDIPLADMHEYYVKDNQGNYCKWDSGKPGGAGFVSLNTSDFSQLTDKEKEDATFHTSMNGAISKIPVDYTVVVPYLVVGTQYMVEERGSEMPDGYSFNKCIRYADKPAVSGADRTESFAPAEGNIVSDHDPYVEVHNLKGFGLRINKVWTDKDYMASRDPTYFAVFCDGALVADTLRQMPYTLNPQSLYWYFLHLESGKTLSNYTIREVKVTDPVVNSEGYVTGYESIYPIVDNETLEIKGTLKGAESSDSINYTVTYEEGQIDQNSNVRIDTAKNDRPGIVMTKTDPNGAPLPGARFSFTLEDGSGTKLGPFTSDDDGRVTIAYLRKDVEYILKETKSPQNYQGLAPMTIIWNKDGTVTINGSDDASYELTQPSDSSASPQLRLVNRSYTFHAYKTDADTGLPVENAVFALHKMFTSGDTSDFSPTPLTGYEILTSDSDGEIKGVNGKELNDLPPGTYQLRETTAPNGYQSLSAYVRFTISEIGEITVDAAHSPEGVQIVTTPDGDMINNILTIPNHRLLSVTLKKVSAESGEPLLGAKFSLTKKNKSVWEAVSGYDEIDLSEDSQVTISSLDEGLYRLEETESPAGYVIISKFIYLKVDSDGQISLTDESGTGANTNREAELTDHETEGDILTVKNVSGTSLPYTGGPGTCIFYILGGICVTLAWICIMMRRRGRFSD